MLDADMLCPCGSGHRLSACCGPFIEGRAIPKTPEQLMRSRYTAYTMADIPYIESTMRGDAALGYDPIEAALWAKNVKWKRLKVIATSSDGKKGMVEFVATYSEHGRAKKLQECSRFVMDGGRWYYIGQK